MGQQLEVETTRHIRVDTELYQTVKLCAAKEGRQIKELTEEALRYYIATRDYEIIIQSTSR